MGCSLREARARIDSREFSFWKAWDSIEPIGERRADLRAGIVAAAVANSAGKVCKSTKRPADFMPLLRRSSKKPSQKELIAKVKAALLAVGKKKGGRRGDDR